MKMTNEEHRAFICQYYGFKIWKDGSIVGESGKSLFSQDSRLFYLELRSVEQLTDDELEGLSKTINAPCSGSSIVGERVLAGLDLRTHFNCGTEISMLVRPTVESIDYLRSIGVLVGFRHFTPEMLIAEGVVKLKQLDKT